MGIITPTSGNIFYDGKKLTAIKKSSFHQHVALVSQESHLFNLTIRENIAFSNQVDDASLERAIATAELENFIQTLPE